MCIYIYIYISIYVARASPHVAGPYPVPLLVAGWLCTLSGLVTVGLLCVACFFCFVRYVRFACIVCFFGFAGFAVFACLLVCLVDLVCFAWLRVPAGSYCLLFGLIWHATGVDFGGFGLARDAHGIHFENLWGRLEYI